ncbi:MAG: rhodanese-like domain-containing protein [Cyclobacteriaceae bacterium]
MIKKITVEELNNLINEEADFQLIDVREPHEIEIATIGGELIPLGQVPNNIQKFDKDAEWVVVYCRSGKRSATAIRTVQQSTGQENLYNLEGGILEWADKIDQSITKY